MHSRRHISSPGMLLATAGLSLCAVALLAQSAGPAAQRRTTKDGVYTLDQAKAGKAVFDEFCAACHGFKPWAKSGLNPDLAGEVFLTSWDGKTLQELQSLILVSMPSDGSAVLTEAQVVEAVAFILQQNGFSPGSRPLPAGAAAAAIAIAK